MADLSILPSIRQADDYLLSQGLPSGLGVRWILVDYLTQLRQQLQKTPSTPFTRERILEALAQEVRLKSQSQRILNLTGVVIHTNLGRSLFSPELISRIQSPLTEYQDLEFDIQTASRGHRGLRVEGLLQSLTGAEAALVVNNNAAAVLLVLQVLARNLECIVSRGELVEIGGSFRIPEVMEASGAKLKEVGATNKTHLQDYQKALGPNTALILKVHTSNFQVLGFTAAPEISDLAKLAHEHGLPLVEDQGSGFIQATRRECFGERSVQQALKEGVDLVTISGDKLLGGPQAGILLGKKEWIEKLRRSPLYRALRVDKLTLTLLEETLKAYAQGQEAELVPTQRMLFESTEVVKARAEQVLAGLPKEKVRLVQLRSKPGGGSLPLVEIDSWGLELNFGPGKAQGVFDSLMRLSTPILGLIREDRVLLDCRTLLPHQIHEFQTLLQGFLS